VKPQCYSSLLWRMNAKMLKFTVARSRGGSSPPRRFALAMVDFHDATAIHPFSPLGGVHLLFPADHRAGDVQHRPPPRFQQRLGEHRRLWLPTTRVLGDLNNFTSDFRAAEGSDLLSSNPARSPPSKRTWPISTARSRRPSTATRTCTTMPTKPASTTGSGKLAQLSRDREHVLELSRKDQKAEAVSLYMTNSRWAYNAASDALGI